MKSEQVSSIFDRLFVLLDEPSDSFITPLLSSGLERFLDNAGHSILANLLIDKILKCFFHKVVKVKIEALIFFEKNWSLLPEKKQLLVARNIHDFYHGPTSDELAQYLSLKLAFFVTAFKEFYTMGRFDFEIIREFLNRLAESTAEKDRTMFVFNFPAIFASFPDKVADLKDKYFECSSDQSPQVRSYWIRTLPDVLRKIGDLSSKIPNSMLKYVEHFMDFGLGKNFLEQLICNLHLIYRTACNQSLHHQANSNAIKEDRHFFELIERLFQASKEQVGGRVLNVFYTEVFRIWQFKEHDRASRMHKFQSDKLSWNFLTEFLLDKCFEDYKHGNYAVQTITLNILLAITASTTSIKERVVILLKLQDEFLKVSSKDQINVSKSTLFKVLCCVVREVFGILSARLHNSHGSRIQIRYQSAGPLCLDALSQVRDVDLWFP